MPVGQVAAVLLGRQDGLQPPAVVEDDLGEPRVGPVRQAGHPHQLPRRIPPHLRAHHVAHPLGDRFGQPAVPGDPHPHGRPFLPSLGMGDITRLVPAELPFLEGVSPSSPG